MTEGEVTVGVRGVGERDRLGGRRWEIALRLGLRGRGETRGVVGGRQRRAEDGGARVGVGVQVLDRPGDVGGFAAVAAGVDGAPPARKLQDRNRQWGPPRARHARRGARAPPPPPARPPAARGRPVGSACGRGSRLTRPPLGRGASRARGAPPGGGGRPTAAATGGRPTRSAGANGTVRPGAQLTPPPPPPPPTPAPPPAAAHRRRRLPRRRPRQTAAATRRRGGGGTRWPRRDTRARPPQREGGGGGGRRRAPRHGRRVPPPRRAAASPSSQTRLSVGVAEARPRAGAKRGGGERRQRQRRG